MARWTRGTVGCLVLAVWAIAVAEAADPPALVIVLENKAGVPARLLESALAEVEGVFQAAGVAVTWTDGPGPAADAASGAGGPVAVTVMLGTMESPCTGSGCVLGLAILKRMTALVFANRVDELASRHPIDPGVILGRVIAHEIGHLLLPPGRHAHQGLMRGEIEVGFGRPSRLTKEEARIVRERLTLSPGR